MLDLLHLGPGIRSLRRACILRVAAGVARALRCPVSDQKMRTSEDG